MVFEYEEFSKQKLASPPVCMDPSFDTEMCTFELLTMFKLKDNSKNFQVPYWVANVEPIHK